MNGRIYLFCPPHFAMSGAPGGPFVASLDERQRAIFFQRVFGILAAQLTTTFGFVAWFQLDASVRSYVLSVPRVALASLLLGVVALIGMAICKPRGAPLVVALAIFTVCDSYTIGVIAALYDASVVLEAAAFTVAITAACMVWGWTTKRDLARFETALFVTLVMVTLSGLVCVAFPATPLVDTALAALGALVFAAYVVIDTQRIAKRTSAEDYVFAAIDLYVDITRLFINLIELLAKLDELRNSKENGKESHEHKTS